MKSSILALAIATTTGAAALTYSPMPCACESSWQLVYAAAGLPIDPYRYFSPADVERGLNRHLAGTVVRGSSSYFFDACRAVSRHQLACILDTEQAGLSRRGYIISLELDQSGKFRRAHVKLHASRR